MLHAPPSSPRCSRSFLISGVQRFAAVAFPLAALAALLGACDDDGVSSFVPELRMSPAVLEFGEVSIGGTQSAELTVINDGNAPLELAFAPTARASNPALEGVFTVESPAGFPLPGGEFTTVTVHFRPTIEAPIPGTLVLPFESPIERTEVAINGVGVPPPITLSPGSIDFGSIDAGTTLVELVTVTNESDEALVVDLSIASPAFSFGESAGAASLLATVELGPGESAPVDVVFGPPGAGAFTGELIAEICGPRCGPSVVLTGEGRAPRIAATPRPLDFGAVSVGDASTLDLELSNAGVGTLVITRLSLEDASGTAQLGEGFGDDDLPIEISPDEIVALPVRYEPTTPIGEFQATLVIDSNDPLSPRVAVPIRATTPGASLRVLPSALHFGRLDEDEQRVLDVVLLSAGTDSVDVTGIEIVGEGNGAFEVVGLLPSFPLTMDPNESLLISLQATSRAVDQANSGANAQLDVATLNESVSVAMTFASGNAGCQPAARPSNLAFGNMRVGQGANGRVTIENEGDGVCTLVRAIPAAGLSFDPGFNYQTLSLDELGPGESGSVQFAFQASTDGPATAVLAVEFDEQPAPLLLSASARGVTGSMIVVPPSVSIGPEIEGCVAGSVLLSLVNEGAGDVTVNELALDAATNWLRMIAPPTPFVVGAGGTVDLRVEAQPGAPIGVFSGVVRAETEETGTSTARVELVVEPSGTPVTEQFTAADSATSQVDILFVIDDSGSMGDDQQILAANFFRFVESAFLTEAGTDVQVGVTTTDVLSQFGADGRLVGFPAILRSGTPNLAALFQEKALVGIDGAGIELGLEAMRRALDGRNPGFPRRNAALSIVIVSDEDDSGYQNGPPFDRSPESYISSLRALKAGSLSGAPVLVSLVVYPGYSPRYETVAAAFEGVTLDITSPTWGEDLGVIGAATVGLSRLFRLSNRPAEGSLTVSINGVPTTAFAMDSTGNSILLDEDPPAGAEIIVAYEVVCGG